MITFSTEFPLDAKHSATDVLRLACDWLTGSPHTTLAETELDELPEDDAREVRGKGESVIVASARNPEFTIAGLQYHRAEESLEWVTSIVARQDSTETLFSLQVSCEAYGTTPRLPPPKKPYFIKQALTVLGGGTDGEIPVSDKPFHLNDGEAAIAAALIKGVAKNRLPIVYLSRGFDGHYPVEPDGLATYISGLAHVIVEPSRAFSAELRDLVDGRNVYGGTIGVYWPQSSARNSYYLEKFSGDTRELQRSLWDDVRRALANRRLSTGCTWAHLQEQLSRLRIARLKHEGSASIDDYVQAFDAELHAKDQRLTEADAEISRLNAEIRRLSASAGSSSAGLLSLGKEHDLYPQEVRDLVISVLRDSLRNLREGSRRQHLVKDLLEANAATGAVSKMDTAIKSIMRTYQSMDAKSRSELSALGFDISEDGKHYKITFRGDPRYMFTLPKTSSDHRSGKNLSSDITGTLF